MTIISSYHVPVMLHPSVDALDLQPGGTYVDVTFGGGGHSREILRRMDAGAHLYSFDQDADAERNIPQGDSRFTFVRSNFRFLANWMRYYGVEAVDGILADLGVSSHHFDDETRGFSFRFDAPLDMRMNARDGMTAAQVVNTYDEERLADLLRLYGELKNGRQMAAAICRARAKGEMRTVAQLIEAVEPLVGRDRKKKDLAKVFQALRIEVNHEMHALAEMLEAAKDVLRPGGRLVVLTYHSLEDRMVKNFLRAGRIDGKQEQDFYGNRLSAMRPLGGKALTPSAEEQEENPRSRSAKLRVGIKTEEK